MALGAASQGAAPFSVSYLVVGKGMKEQRIRKVEKNAEGVPIRLFMSFTSLEQERRFEVAQDGKTVFPLDAINCADSTLHGHWVVAQGEASDGSDPEDELILPFKRVVPRVLPTLHWVDDTHHAFDDLVQKTRAYRIACDFDEVIHQGISKFTVPSEIQDPPFPGALAWIRDLLDKEVVLIIHTCRFSQWCTTSQYLFVEGPEKVEVEIQAWFLAHGLEQHYIDQLHFWRYVGKPSADVYIDDKAFCFRGHFPLVLDLQGIKARAFDDRARVLETAAHLERLKSVEAP